MRHNFSHKTPTILKIHIHIDLMSTLNIRLFTNMYLVLESKSSCLKFKKFTRKKKFTFKFLLHFNELKSRFIPQLISWKPAFRWLFTWPSLESKIIKFIIKRLIFFRSVTQKSMDNVKARSSLLNLFDQPDARRLT